MKKFLLVLIILLSLVLRFYKLSTYPALNADEAAIGYNAYSLLQTGKDEHGNPWPIHFQSFNDYKPGLYVYMVMPFVATFGLNEWAVRMPGAALGALTVLMVYFLIRELFPEKEEKSFATLSALFIAISPWHIQFSRGGWEVNVSTFFITAGLLFLLKSFKSKNYLYVSALLFVLSLYTYHASRIVVPLLLLGTAYIKRNELFKVKKSVFMSSIFALFLLIPLVFDLLGPAGVSRAAGVGLFADPGPKNRINELRGEHGNYESDVAVVFHNKAVNYGIAFLENWASHYHGEFLFLSGDTIQRNKVPETGELYLFEIFTLGIGLFSILKRVGKRQMPDHVRHDEVDGWKILLWWLLIAPTAAALTFQSPHALRAENMVIPLEIISAYGLYVLCMWSKNNIRAKNLLFSVYCLLFIVVSWNFTRYIHMYYTHMSKEYPYSSQYGVKELVDYIDNSSDSSKDVIVTTRYDQPYILFLFYLKYPPAEFQKDHQLTQKDQFGFSTVNHFGNYYFQPIDFSNLKTQMPGSIIAGTKEEIPKEANVIRKIYGTNGFEYFDVVAN
jgi:hypothetical protein